jgi:coenzyme PQQ precursor peptide PqqA
MLAARSRPHENHEGSFIEITLSPGGKQVQHETRSRNSLTEPGALMRWVTPKAVDFRFGMEVTMYIANR